MAVQETVRRLGHSDLVELFERLHKHVSGNTYCNMAGCLKLWYKCVEVDRDPYTVCTKEEPVVELYGYAEKAAEELRQYVHDLENLYNEASDMTMFFRQGKASLEQVKRAWTRYWNLVSLVKRNLAKSEKLLELALGTSPEEIEQETEQDDPCSKIRDALEEFLG